LHTKTYRQQQILQQNHNCENCYLASVRRNETTCSVVYCYLGSPLAC